MDSGLNDTRAQYLAGALTKHEYVERMHRFHALLFEYAELIRSTEIGKIEIDDGRLIMTTRLGVRFLCDPRDPRLPPLQAIDFGRYEGAEADMLFRLIEPGSAVYDVGANVGWYPNLADHFRNISQ